MKSGLKQEKPFHAVKMMRLADLMHTDCKAYGNFGQNKMNSNMNRIIFPVLAALISGNFNTLNACTVFTASDGKTVLVGNNEDSSPSLKTFLWYYPKQRNRYGFVSWGSKSKYPEGGMNEKGLFWDAAALMQAIPTVRDPGKPDFNGYFVNKALSECATVAEVIQLVRRYNLVWQDRAQVLVADASGDYALIHSNYIIRKSDLKKPYVAVANFCLDHYVSGQSACYRYNTADSMLQKQPVSFSLFRTILAKAAQKDPDNATIYSQIADLKSGIIHLYQRHNFNQEVTISLSEELKKGAHKVEMKSLFPVSICERLGPIIERHGFERAFAKYQQWKKQDPDRYQFSESELEELGYDLLNKKKIKDAVSVFTLNRNTFPKSDNAISSLANAYLIDGNKTMANALYQKALQINPDNYAANLFNNQEKGFVTFRFKNLEYAGKIRLAGSFNNWNADANPFVKDADGNWVCQLKLQPGVYQYTFLVGDDNWMTDPLNKLAVKPDKNWRSLLIVQ